MFFGTGIKLFVEPRKLIFFHISMDNLSPETRATIHLILQITASRFTYISAIEWDGTKRAKVKTLNC